MKKTLVLGLVALMAGLCHGAQLGTLTRSSDVVMTGQPSIIGTVTNSSGLVVANTSNDGVIKLGGTTDYTSIRHAGGEFYLAYQPDGEAERDILSFTGPGYYPTSSSATGTVATALANVGTLEGLFAPISVTGDVSTAQLNAVSNYAAQAFYSPGTTNKTLIDAAITAAVPTASNNNAGAVLSARYDGVSEWMDGLRLSTYIEPKSQPWGKVLNILAVGQSNMTGIPGTNTWWNIDHPRPLLIDNSPLLDKTLFYYHYDAKLRRAKMLYSDGWGLDSYMLWALRSTDHYTICTKSGENATALDAFLPGGVVWTAMTNDYAGMLTQAATPLAAMKITAVPAAERSEIALSTENAVDVLVFGQGESYKTDPTRTYYTMLTNFIESVKTYYNSPDLKIVFNGINHYYDSNPSHTAHLSDAAFRRYVSEHPTTTRYVWTKDLSVRSDHAALNGENPTDVHYSQWGLRDLGYRVAGAIRSFYDTSVKSDQFSIHADDITGKKLNVAEGYINDLRTDNVNLSGGTIEQVAVPEILGPNADAGLVGYRYSWKGALRWSESFGPTYAVLTDVNGYYSTTGFNARNMTSEGFVQSFGPGTKHSSIRLVPKGNAMYYAGQAYSMGITAIDGANLAMEMYRSAGTKTTLAGTPVRPADDSDQLVATINTNLYLDAGTWVQCGSLSGSNKSMLQVDTANYGAITQFADAGSGRVRVYSANNKLVTGEQITITGTSNYNGTYYLYSYDTSVQQGNAAYFTITATWAGNDATGTWFKPGTFNVRGFYETNPTAYTALVISTNTPIIVNGTTNAAARITGLSAGTLGAGGYNMNDLVYATSDGIWFAPKDLGCYRWKFVGNLHSPTNTIMPVEWPTHP